MAKKEYKIGETFQFGLVTLKCIMENERCRGCFFKDFRSCSYFHSVIGHCTQENRDDNNGVIFVVCAETEEPKQKSSSEYDTIDWEQYRAMSAIATIQGAYNNKMFDNLDVEAIADIAIKQADALIKGLKKHK